MDSEFWTVQPPPYSQLNSSPSDAFLTRMTDHLSQDQSSSATAPQDIEVARVRNFTIFMISIDYQCNTNAQLSATDREHFTTMHNQLRDLQRAHSCVTPTPSQRQILGSYFWHHLHDPCKALHLPVECVLNAMSNLTKFTDYKGWYKGNCFAILQSSGVAGLAEKLYMDRSIVIPRLVYDQTLRKNYLRCLDQVQGFYFLSIDGIEASTMPRDDDRRQWLHVQNISYKLNTRGQSYATQRKSAINQAARGIEFSLLHWRAKAGRCIAAIAGRRQEILAGTRKRDPLMGWRGDGDEIDMSLPVPKRLWQWPFGWLYYVGWHLPDYFENRSRTRYTDA